MTDKMSLKIAIVKLIASFSNNTTVNPITGDLEQTTVYDEINVDPHYQRLHKEINEVEQSTYSKINNAASDLAVAILSIIEGSKYDT
jgi:hypothetical protein